MTEKFIPFNDGAFKYTGVWQSDNGSEIISYHTAAQLEFGFNGSEIKLKAKSMSAEYVEFWLDGERITPEAKSDKLFVIRTSDSSHTLKIIMTRHSKLRFWGVYLDEEKALFRTDDNKYIQFIGDSITDAYPGFSTTVANNLGVDYSIVSLCGISLVNKWGWYKLLDGANERIGMESTYFSLNNPQEIICPPEYRFENCRIPDAFVVYLGTNDYISREEQKAEGNCEIFAKKYFDFIGEIRKRFGNKPICILQTHRQDPIRKEAIENAYKLMDTKFMNLHLLDCYNWGVELQSDGVHPTKNGYETLAEKVTEYIKNKNILK